MVTDTSLLMHSRNLEEPTAFMKVSLSDLLYPNKNTTFHVDVMGPLNRHTHGRSVVTINHPN